MTEKKSEVKKMNEEKKPKIAIETSDVKKTKVKRLPKGERKHVRRMKSAERKEAIIVNPK